VVQKRRIHVVPVTSESWQAFARFFGANGSPHYCWCTSYRVPNAGDLTSAQKRACMQRTVESGVPVGVLAFMGDEPIGWCSVAPRETCARLGKSRTMPRATPLATSTWTILCFFVARAHRKRRVARALLDGAVAYARQQGAAVVEGYPFDTAGVSSTHRGHSSLFEAAGFVRDGRRWFLRTRPGRNVT
jgi:GNAT superfamily N-acetyltransferase